MLRKSISVLIGPLAILSALTGIGEAMRPWESLPIHHIIISSLFILVACLHTWLNRKALAHSYKTFGWNWVWVAGTIVVIIVLAAIIF